MAEEVNLINSWLPVIGTLSGAIVGFAASLATSWWNNKQQFSKNKEERERARLEDAYKTLIAISRDYHQMLGQALNHIHYNRGITVDTDTEIPPLIKFEMLVALYLPQLNNEWQKLIKSKGAFGEEYAKLIGIDHQSKSLEFKQKLSEKFLQLHKQVNHDIKSLQKEVAKIIKP